VVLVDLMAATELLVVQVAVVVTTGMLVVQEHLGKVVLVEMVRWAFLVVVAVQVPLVVMLFQLLLLELVVLVLHHQ
jgi:hypothetical protein